MSDPFSERNSPVEIECESNVPVETFQPAIHQPPDEIQNGNRQKEMKLTDRIRNIFSSNRRNTNETTTDGQDGSSGSRRKSFAILDGINDKKTIANGLMDFAFLTANANQLHNAVRSSSESQERTSSIILISISIFIQVIVGILLIIGSYIQGKPIVVPTAAAGVDAQLESNADGLKLTRLNFINHLTIGLVFLVAILNIFIASFTIKEPSSSPDNNNTY